MHKIIVLFFLSFSMTTAKSECASGIISCWPGYSPIKKNAVFVITFYGTSQNIVSQIDSKNHIYLKSGDEKLPLLIKEIHKGEFRLTQVLLKPASELTEGSVYEIFIDSLPPYEVLIGWNPQTKKYARPRWEVSNKRGTENPKWLKTPTYDSKSVTEFGCGPGKTVNFNFQAGNSSGILIKTTVKSLQTLKETTFYLDKEEDQIRVGHGMCDGAFHFDDGDKYEVSFQLMDQSGNLSTKNAKPIRFSRPTITTQSKQGNH
ncbi:MAG: hypothetical protein V4557_19065 [Bacteroidota bacterium]